MTRTIAAFCVAAAFGMVAAASAQEKSPTTSDPNSNDVTVNGCLVKTADGKYSLTKATATGIAAIPAAGKGPNATWKVDVTDVVVTILFLPQRIGQRLEAKGKLGPDASPTLQIQSLRALDSPSCS